MVWRYLGRTRMTPGWRRPNGSLIKTPSTCCTDLLFGLVQNSTTLFEVLPTRVMDSAMMLHDHVMRSNLAKHQGYESVTEGDAFIMSFPNPAVALQFCMDVQRDLLNTAWPTEVRTIAINAVHHSSCFIL